MKQRFMDEHQKLAKAAAWMRRLTSAVDDLLYPQDTVCLCCERGLDESACLSICPACWTALCALGEAQRTREAAEKPMEIEGIAGVHAAYPYDAQAKRLIWMLKYESVRSAAKPLAVAMAQLPLDEAEMIVPVPIDRMRLKKRGFSQTDLLAELIGRETGLPVVHALRRVDSRMPQTLLPAEQRRVNLVGCMEVSKAVSGKRIVLVDDVVTTGSTMTEAARALKEGGAAEITALSAARAGGVRKDDAEPFPLLYAYEKRGFSSKIHANL